jgi:Tfp pilus assembly protein PilZ
LACRDIKIRIVSTNLKEMQMLSGQSISWIHKGKIANCYSHITKLEEELILAMRWLNGWSNRKHDYRRQIIWVHMKENSGVCLKITAWGKGSNSFLSYLNFFPKWPIFHF